jgi:hypothetical protein
MIERDAGYRLDHAVEAESDQRDASGNGPCADCDDSLDHVPAHRKDLETKARPEASLPRRFRHFTLKKNLARLVEPCYVTVRM